MMEGPSIKIQRSVTFPDMLPLLYYTELKYFITLKCVTRSRIACVKV